MRFGWLGTGAIGLLVVVGCSTRPESGPSGEGSARAAAQPIQGGTTDTTNTYVVGVCIGGKGNCQGVCTGTLITPNVVVTARHCIDESPQQIDCTKNPQFGARVNQVWITTSSNMFQSTVGWHQVESVATPTDASVCGHDIAVLVLANLVPGGEATPIVPGVQYPMNDPKYSTKFEAIGYGITSPSGQDSGTRRIRKNVRIQCIPGDENIDCPKNVGIDDNEFFAGSGTCEGDSGSGAYEANTFGTSKSVTFGVLSRGGTSTDGTTCEGSLYTRLDKYRDLIVQTVTAASSNWTLYAKPNPDWTVFVPPPVADAGTDAKPTTKPSGLGLGEACDVDKDCSSGTCAPSGDAKVCASACATSAECPDGFECRDSLCLAAVAPPPAPPATPTVTTTTGCSVRSLEPQPTPWRWIALAAGLVGLARVRRRR